MVSDGLLHLLLYGPVSRVHVVELLLSALAVVQLLLRVQVFVDVENLSLAAQEQPKVVESGMCIFVDGWGGGVLVEQGGVDEYELSEVEVIADAAFLVIDDGMSDHSSLHHRVVVAVYHGGVGVGGHSQKSLQRVLSQPHGCGLGAYEHVFRICPFRNLQYGISAQGVSCLQEFHSLGYIVDVVGVARQQVYVLYGFACRKVAYGLGEVCNVCAGQEAVYFLSHILLRCFQRFFRAKLI